MAVPAPLAEVAGMFVALAVAGWVAERAGQSVVPAYVLAGVAAGPHGVGRLGGAYVHDREFVAVVATLGVVLILFFLGLEFSLDRLLAGRRRLAAAGGVDLAVNFPAGVAVGLALGWSPVEAFVLGGVVYVSSSAVITKSLVDLGWTANPESEPVLGTLVVEDVVVAVYLAVLSALVLGGDVAGTARAVATALLALAALVGVARYGRRPLSGLLAGTGGEGVVLRTVALTAAAAAAALAAGVSEAVAAFFVGSGLATTGHVERLETLLAPLRDLFAAVFFFRVGLETDPAVLAGTAGLLAALVAVSTAGKLATGFLGGRLYDLDRRRSFRVAAAMVTRGEFSLVVATVAATGAGPVLAETIPAVVAGYVVVMSVLGTVLTRYADAVWDRLGGGP